MVTIHLKLKLSPNLSSYLSLTFSRNMFLFLFGGKKICVWTHTHAHPEPDLVIAGHVYKVVRLSYAAQGTLPLAAPRSRVTFPPLLIAPAMVGPQEHLSPCWIFFPLY